MYEVLIVADENDADFVTSINVIEDDKLAELKKILEMVKARKIKSWGHNWETGEQGNPHEAYKGLLSTEQIDWFNNLVPDPEFGIHTIHSVEYYPVPKKIRLL